ncbi:porin [Paraburkholderia phymatum]|nr:porin [Paraburkholderia phymatum]
MRRLPALACAVGFASQAVAQGSVTLYGLIDTSIEVTNPGSGYVARMDSGTYRGTRFGLQGSEPLGDGALRANFAGASYRWGALTGFAAYFNGDGGTPRYHDDGASVSAQWQFAPHASASVGYAHARDGSGGDNDADPFSVAFDYQVSKALLLYLSAADLENRGQAAFTLRGVNVTGIPVAYPGAPVRGVQVGMIERF